MGTPGPSVSDRKKKKKSLPLGSGRKHLGGGGGATGAWSPELERTPRPARAPRPAPLALPRSAAPGAGRAGGRGRGILGSSGTHPTDGPARHAATSLGLHGGRCTEQVRTRATLQAPAAGAASGACGTQDPLSSSPRESSSVVSHTPRRCSRGRVPLETVKDTPPSKST